MSPERPFLTAHWTKLLMLNFAVPPEVVERMAPPGTVPDLFGGQAYVSVVGFLFHDARLFGFRPPGQSALGGFGEVNLRFYVCREMAGETRRGVVFVKEIVPRWTVALTARWFYNQNFVRMPVRCDHSAAGELAASDEVGYRWRTGGWRRGRWNRVAARAAAAPQLPAAGSLEEFVIDHYWAYGVDRDGVSREYHVERPLWRIAPAADVVWDCDVAGTYVDSPLATYLHAQPVMAMIADGSAVKVYRGRRIPVLERTPSKEVRKAAAKSRTTAVK